MKNTEVLSLIVFCLIIIPATLISQPCGNQRYLDNVLTGQRTVSGRVYNQSPALQGACILESNTTMNSYTLDVYEPINDPATKRPAIVYAHGGAFLIGDKRIIPVPSFATKMAEKGYVFISIDYRKCFNTASTAGAERAVFRAIQDMNAALRWTREFADSFNIDTSLIFAGGNSSGSVMAIHAAYAEDDELGLVPAVTNPPALGCLDCTGNAYIGSSEPKAVINLWGAAIDTIGLEPGDQPIISFHGNQDNAVLMNFGVPFSYPAFPPLYGSAPITQRANNLGIINEFHVFQGLGHEPWLTNSDLVDTIADKTASFLFRHFLKPDTPPILGFPDVCTRDTMIFLLNGSASSEFCWQISGNAHITEINQNGSQIKIVSDSAGSFSLSVTEINIWKATGDMESRTINIWEKPLANAGADQFICLGDSIGIQASGDGLVEWTPAYGLSNSLIINPFASPDSTIEYTLELSSTFCYDYDVMRVIVRPLPHVHAGPDLTICQGDSVELNGTGNGMPTWSPSLGIDEPGSLNPVAKPFQSQKYYLSILDLNACRNIDSVMISVNNRPSIPTIQASGSVLTSTNAYNYQWWVNDQRIPGATDPVHTATQSGNYQVQISDSLGCTSFSEYYNYLATGISNLKPNESPYIMLNAGHLYIDFSSQAVHPLQLNILSLDGKIITNIFLDLSYQKTVSVNIDDLPSSAYIIQIPLLGYARKILIMH